MCLTLTERKEILRPSARMLLLPLVTDNGRGGGCEGAQINHLVAVIW